MTVYYFRIYGRGWFITSSKLYAHQKLEQYAKKGLIRNKQIFERKTGVELD